MEAKKQVKETKKQKKFRHLKDENPVFFLETFLYNMKTHYIVSSSTILYLGYMEKGIFNQIITYNIGSYVLSYCLFQDCLYFGLRNGCIIFVSLEHAYNSIPFKKVESIDGKGILGISASNGQKSQEIQLYTISQGTSFKLYRQYEDGFKLANNIEIKRKVSKVVSKNSLSQLDLPIFMIYLKQYRGYPIMLTLRQMDQLIYKQIDFQQILTSRQNKYLVNEILYSTLTTMDYDVAKMVATIGYGDGTIEVLKIEKVAEKEKKISEGKKQMEEEETCFFIMTAELRVMQRDAIVCVCIIPDPLCAYIGYVSERSFSGINYDKRSTPFSKIKLDRQKTQKQISICRWTKDKYFIAGSISTQDKRRSPKIYCVQQDLPDEV